MSSGAKRLDRCSLSERRPRWSITTQRTCAGCSRAPATGACKRYPDAPGRRSNVFNGKGNKTGRCMCILVRTPETKCPRDLRPEGIRVASGDRGGRSPREYRPLVGVPLAFETRIARAQIRAAIRPQGKQMGVEGWALHLNSLVGKMRNKVRRPRTIRGLFSGCNNFFTNIFWPEKGGCVVASDPACDAGS
jgi:hypothetical protein